MKRRKEGQEKKSKELEVRRRRDFEVYRRGKLTGARERYEKKTRAIELWNGGRDKRKLL